MVRHIVLWTFKDFTEGASKDENLKKAKAMLVGMRGGIEGMTSVEAGINCRPAPEAYDLALCAEFESEAALDGYQRHPEHLKVVGFLRKVRVNRAVADYVIE